MMDYKRLYKTWSGTIPAGGSVKISMGGFYIRFLESDATGLIAVNDGDPGVAVGGLGLSLPDGFENFRLTNPNGTDWTVTVGVSEGAIEDSRLNVPSGIDVNLASDPQGAAILAMMQNADEQRVGVISLGESSAAGSFPTSAVQVINPSLNVNGVVIRHIHMEAGALTGILQTGAVVPAALRENVVAKISNSVVNSYQQIGVPAGIGVWARADTAGGYYAISWDYL